MTFKIRVIEPVAASRFSNVTKYVMAGRDSRKRELEISSLQAEHIGQGFQDCKALRLYCLSEPCRVGTALNIRSMAVRPVAVEAAEPNVNTCTPLADMLSPVDTATNAAPYGRLMLRVKFVGAV